MWTDLELAEAAERLRNWLGTAAPEGDAAADYGAWSPGQWQAAEVAVREADAAVDPEARRRALRAMAAEETGESLLQRSRMIDGLQRARTGRQAMHVVRKWRPAWSADEVGQFLRSVRFDAVLPTPPMQRCLGRLGIWRKTKPADNGDAELTFHDATQRWARAAGVTNWQLAQMLERLVRDKGPCGARPGCAGCPLNALCVFGKEALRTAAAPKARRITDLAAEERPRERLAAGAQLSDAELLAILLRTGAGQRSALDLARDLIDKFGSLAGLEAASLEQMAELRGVGMTKAITIRAAMELGRRVVTGPVKADEPLLASGHVFRRYHARFRAATQEEFLVLLLDTKMRVTREVRAGLGTLDGVIVHPRDIFGEALRGKASRVIVMHNHPSGDPQPSAHDVQLTRRLAEAGKLVGIPLADHIILGRDEYYSFRDMGVGILDV